MPASRRHWSGHFPDLIGTQPELLARHLTGAAEAERAVEQWLKAGQFAAVRLAHLEAIRHFDRGLALVGSLPESVARDRQEAELQLARGLSLFTTEGFISNAAAQAYARAHELAEKRADARQLFVAIYGRWQGSAGAGRVLEGRHLSTRLLGLTEGEVESGSRLQAHHTAWTTCLFGGERQAASIAMPVAGFMMPSGIGPIVCCLVGTIPAFVLATWPLRRTGCSAIQRRHLSAAAKGWRWPNGSRTH